MLLILSGGVVAITSLSCYELHPGKWAKYCFRSTFKIRENTDCQYLG